MWWRKEAKKPKAAGELGLSEEDVCLLKKTLGFYSKKLSQLNDHDIYIISWDCEVLVKPPEDITAVLPPASWEEPDVMVVGLQNVQPETSGLWLAAVDLSIRTYGDYSPLTSHSKESVTFEGGCMCLVYVREDLSRYIHGVSVTSHPSTGRALAVRFGLHQSSLCFVSASLYQMKIPPELEAIVQTDSKYQRQVLDALTSTGPVKALRSQQFASIEENVIFRSGTSDYRLNDHSIIVFVGCKDLGYHSSTREELSSVDRLRTVDMRSPPSKQNAKVELDVLQAGVIRLCLEVRDSNGDPRITNVAPEILLLRAALPVVDASRLRDLYVGVWRALKSPPVETKPLTVSTTFVELPPVVAGTPIKARLTLVSDNRRNLPTPFRLSVMSQDLPSEPARAPTGEGMKALQALKRMASKPKTTDDKTRPSTNELKVGSETASPTKPIVPTLNLDKRLVTAQPPLITSTRYTTLDLGSYTTFDPPEGVILGGQSLTIDVEIKVKRFVDPREQVRPVLAVIETPKNEMVVELRPSRLVPSLLGHSISSLTKLAPEESIKNDQKGMVVLSCPRHSILPLPKEIWWIVRHAHNQLLAELDALQMGEEIKPEMWFNLSDFLESATTPLSACTEQLQREVLTAQRCVERGFAMSKSVSVAATLRLLEEWCRNMPNALVPRDFVTEIHSNNPNREDFSHLLCRAVLLSLPQSTRNILISLVALLREILDHSWRKNCARLSAYLHARNISDVAELDPEDPITEALDDVDEESRWMMQSALIEWACRFLFRSTPTRLCHLFLFHFLTPEPLVDEDV
ncbi:MAG: hypothetical protein KVP17_003220 [Porospora cf. gigantea B]|uniref:uncharacterized protein n=1 Tax=Porospora cf. gigantea B TaxID=2853592 RepID=UPI003571E8D6|nr:MAG: hypothetical protein KVP17_003220 [Porospora cf. gigantea B]